MMWRPSLLNPHTNSLSSPSLPVAAACSPSAAASGAPVAGPFAGWAGPAACAGWRWGPSAAAAPPPPSAAARPECRVLGPRCAPAAAAAAACRSARRAARAAAAAAAPSWALPAAPPSSPPPRRVCALADMPKRRGSTLSTMGATVGSLTFQMRQVPSKLQDSSASGTTGLKSTQATGPAWPTSTATGAPTRPPPSVPRSCQTRMVVSMEAEATRVLSQLTDRSVTSPSWPRQVHCSRCVCADQTCTCQKQAAAMRPPPRQLEVGTLAASRGSGGPSMACSHTLSSPGGTHIHALTATGKAHGQWERGSAGLP